MNFTFVEFPCTVDLNAFKAYFNLGDVVLPKIYGKSLVSASEQRTTADGHTNQPESLRHLVLDAIVANWSENPIFSQLPRQEDRNYILANLDVGLPLKLLSAHIEDNFFWRKSYQQRWKAYQTGRLVHAKPWINVYMERHLQEFIENLPTCDYEQEGVQTTLDICAAYVNQLEINYLQPATDGRNDHIPLDFILSNLPELRTLRLAFCTKTVGIHFCLGSNTLTPKDITMLARGLSRSHELEQFCLHSTKLQPYQLPFLARALDKGCHQLRALALVHCAVGDEGIRQFLQSCHKESFATLRCLDLTNNKISAEGAYILSRTLAGLSLQKLVLRLNPIKSDGAATIFATLPHLPIEHLDVSGCGICEAITKLFMQLIIQNKTLLSLDVSNNELGEEFGKQLYKVIGFNSVLQTLDLRNTGLSLNLRNKFKKILQKNKSKTEYLPKESLKI